MPLIPAKGSNVTSNLLKDAARIGRVFDEMQEAVWSIDASTYQVLYVNRAAERIYEREVGEFYENSHLWLEAIHPEDRDRVCEFLGTVVSSGSAEIEYRIILPSTEIRYIRHKAWRIEDELGTPIRIDGLTSAIAYLREERSDRNTQRQLQPITVLLVDEQPSVASSMRRMLASEKDIVFHYCSEPERSLSLAGEIQPTVILQNLASSDADGLSLLRLWRANPATRDIPTIVLGGDDAAGLKLEAIAAGANDYLEKLPDPMELIACIRQHSQAYIKRKQKEISSGSDRQIREAELASHEALFNAFFSAASAGLVIFDDRLRYVLINETLAQMNGLSVGEHIGKSIREVLSPEIVAIIEPVFQNILATGEPILNYEISGKTLNLSEFVRTWVASWFPILGANREPIGIGGVTIETTERKRAEAALLKSEARNRAFVEALPDLLFRMSKDGTYLDFKAPNESELADLPSELIGKNIGEVLPREISQRVLHYIERALSTRLVQVFEYQLTRQGEIRDFEGRITAIAEEEVLGIVRDISDRVSAEKALKESERRFRAIFNSMFQFIGLLKPDGTMLEINQAALDFVDLQHSDIVHRPFWEGYWWTISPDTQNRVREAINRAAAGEFIRYEVDIVGAGNKVITIDFSIKPVFDSCKKVVLLIPEGRDITEQKQAREALRISSERLNLALSAADNGLWDWNVVTGEMYFSPRYVKMLGYEIKEFPTDFISWQKLVHPEDIASTMQALERHFADPKVAYASEHRLRAKSGEWKWHLAEGKVVERDRTGKPVRTIGTSKDIAERKRAEIALRESERRYQSLAKLSPVGIFRTDGAGNNVYSNKRWREISGLSREELRGMGWAQAIHPEDRKRVLREWQAVITSNSPNFSFKCECRILRSDGTVLWVWVQAIAEVGFDGKIVGFVGTITDISDRKQAEVALHRSTLQLQEAQRIAHIGNWEIDVATGAISASDELKRIFGLEAKQAVLTFRDYEKRIHSEDLDLWQKTLERAIAEGDCFEMDLRILRPDGELRYINVRGEALRNEQGQGGRLFGTAMDISDRKKAEQALFEREQFLRTIYDGIDLPIFVVDVLENGDFRYAGWNPADERVFGIRSCDSYGKTPDEVFGAQLGAKLRQMYNNCLLAGTTTISEESMTWQGEESWWINTLNPLRDESGKIYRIVGTANNITERKRAEQKLQEREQFLRSIWEGVDSGIHIFDVLENGEFRYAAFNPSMVRICPIPVEQLIGKTLAEALPPELANEFHQRYQACLDAGTSLCFEDCYHINGENSWWLLSVTPLRNERSQICQLVITATNITERKKAELALQQSEAQLRELAQREALLNRLASQMRHSLDLDTILETTVQEIRNLLQIDRCNFTWYRPSDSTWEVVKEAKPAALPSQLGIYPSQPAESFLLQNLLQLETIRVDCVENADDLEMQQLFKALGYISVFMLPIQTSFGTLGVVSCCHCSGDRPWSDSEVELLSAVAVQLAIAINQAELYTRSRDSARIATAKSLELEQTLRQLQQTQAQLVQSEKMSSLGQLVAGVAHEINNPVNFIFGNLIHAGEYVFDILSLIQLYQTTYPDPTPEILRKLEAIELDFISEDLPKLFDSMKVGAERIREIVRSLRTFSRLDEADMKAVNLHENIDSTLMILQNRLKQNSGRPTISVVKDYSQLPLVECYPGQLNQVFVNILANAIDAIQERDRALSKEAIARNPSTIRISTGVLDSNRVQIRIADNGIGMTQEVMAKIFDPFYTTKPVGAGTGLGLSISYQIIVEKHRGDLRCVSECGKGSEFIIEIPRQQIS